MFLSSGDKCMSIKLPFTLDFVSGGTGITNYGRLVVVREKIWKRNFYGEETSVEHRHARRERITSL